MPDYKKLYFMLFGKIADAVDELDKAIPEAGTTPDLLSVYRARTTLIEAMRSAETIYIESEP